MNTIQIQIKRDFLEWPLPRYATPGASGMDLRADIKMPMEIRPGVTKSISTGIRIAIPPGYEGQIRPRSGLAEKYHIYIPNSPGTVDSDYRGELKVLLTNFGAETFTVQPFMRIAQLVIAPVAQVEWVKVEELTETARGEGGFGHTDIL